MLKRFFCFADLTSEEAREVAGLLGTIDLENGETLFQQGEPSTAVYLLISGEVQIQIEGSDRSPRNLVTLGPGAILGEMGPLTTNRAAPRASRVRIPTSHSFPIARSMPGSSAAIAGQPGFFWRPRECSPSGSQH